MKIVWQESDWPPFLGHGVEFHNASESTKGSLFAFLEGFEWYRGAPETVVILVRRPDAELPASFWVEAKTVIEKALVGKTLWQGHVGGQVWAHLNA
jgi:hypothetical protein